MLLKLMKVSLTAYAMWTYSLAEAAKQEQESSDSVMIASDGSMFASSSRAIDYPDRSTILAIYSVLEFKELYIVLKREAKKGALEEVNALIKVINEKNKSWSSWLTSGLTRGTSSYHFGAALILAAEKGHAEICLSLLLAGANKDLKKSSGSDFFTDSSNPYFKGLTALDYAALNGHISIVKIFAAAGVELQEAFSRIMRYRDVSECRIALKTLLKAGLDVNSPGMDGRFLIVEAAEKGEGTALVKDLIAAGADVHAQDPSSKRTALIAASSCGEIETVEVLLKSGAKADAKDSHGKTALMVSSGNGKIVKLLVEAGADLDLVDGEGQGALSIAARFENKDFLVALNEAGVSLTSHPVLLELAASQEDTDPSFTKVDFLCKLGFDPNKQDSNGDTPLMWAIYGNRLENVRALIRCGADVSIKNYQGKSALDLAQYYKDIEIYQALKQERKSALTFAAQAKKQNKESTASP